MLPAILISHMPLGLQKESDIFLKSDLFLLTQLGDNPLTGDVGCSVSHLIFILLNSFQC